MDTRQRLVLSSLWIAVAALMGSTLEPGLPQTTSQIVRLFVVLLSLFLAGVYLFDPWNVTEWHRAD